MTMTVQNYSELSAVERIAVLIVDDEEIIRNLLERFLTEKGFSVEIAEDGVAALEKVRQRQFNILMTDLQMPRMNGMDVLREIKKNNPYIEVLIISGYPTIAGAVEAIKIGACDFICKPFDLEQLYEIVKQCVKRQQQQARFVRLDELQGFMELNELIVTGSGRSEIARRALTLALSTVNAQRGSLMLYDEQAGELRIVASQGMSREVADSVRLRLGERIAGKVAHADQAVLVTEVAEEIRLAHDTSARYQSESFISIPLICAGSTRRLLGVLNVTDKIDGQAFSVREKKVLSVLAAQTAVALENIRLSEAQRNTISGQ